MKEKMKEEALRRMKKWNLHENIIREFKELTQAFALVSHIFAK